MYQLIRLMCKLAPGEEDVHRILIKMTIIDTIFVPDIAESFPDRDRVRIFFNTRHPVDSVKSYLQIWQVICDTLHYRCGQKMAPSK